MQTLSDKSIMSSTCRSRSYSQYLEFLNSGANLTTSENYNTEGCLDSFYLQIV